MDVERVFREEYGRAVAVLVRHFGDIDAAEEAVQDAFAEAVRRWPRDRGAAEPGGLDHHDRAQPRDRPLPPRGGARGEARAGRAGCARRAGGDGPGGRRPPAADLHLLPPVARARRAGRAHAAAARRADARPRSRAPSSCPSRRWRSGWCAPRARSATRGSPTGCRARPTSRRGWTTVLAVVYLIFNEGHSSLDAPRGPVRGGDPARAPAGRADARRARGARPARAAAADRRPPRRAHAADGALVLLADQDHALWDAREDRRGPRPRPPAARAQPARPVPAAGGDQRRPHRPADRLDPGPRALRPAARAPADGGRRPQPRGRDRRGPRAAGRAGASSTTSSSSTTTASTPSAPTCCAAWTATPRPARPTRWRSSTPTTRPSAAFLEARLGH